MSIIRLEKLLKTGADGALEKIVQRAKKMDDLTTVLKAHVSEEAQAHLVAANLRDTGELVVICSSSSWAARFRFEAEQLIAAARKAGAKVDKCRITVSP